jgi:hypothetical protein
MMSAYSVISSETGWITSQDEYFGPIVTYLHDTNKGTASNVQTSVDYWIYRSQTG